MLMNDLIILLGSNSLIKLLLLAVLPTTKAIYDAILELFE